jgi:polysaccharide pyruvyl transferase CsaB
MMASQQNTILIAGYYGFNNTGDEAILSAMLSSLRAIRPGLHFIVVSGNPAETAAQYGVRSVLWTDLTGILDAARQCGLIILGGGGLFADYWTTYPKTLLTCHHGNNSFYGGFPMLADLNNKPCMIYSVGVGPLRSVDAMSLTRMSFELADVATVRDDESLEVVRSLVADPGVIHVSADAAFALVADKKTSAEVIAKIRPDRNTMMIAVALRYWEFGVSAEKWQIQVAAAFDRFIETHPCYLLFVPMQSQPTGKITDDAHVARNVISLMRHADAATLLEDPHSPADIAGIIAQCDLVVGMRFHSLVFALKEAVPAVGIVYDTKVRNLMSRLNVLQYGLDLVTLKSQQLCETMKNAWENRSEIRSHLQTKVRELKKLASEDSTRAIRLLDASKPVRAEASSLQHIRQFALDRVQLLAEQDSVAKTMADSIAEKERQIGSLVETADQLRAENDKMIKSLAENEMTMRTLSEQQAQLLNDNANLNRLFSQNEQRVQLLSKQLIVKESELTRITSSLGWRLLSRYGQIKYRYLLPVYRTIKAIAHSLSRRASAL